MDTVVIIGGIVAAVVGGGVFLYRMISKQSPALKDKRLSDISYFLGLASGAVSGVAAKTETKIDDYVAAVLAKADESLKAFTGKGLSEGEKVVATQMAQALEAKSLGK